MRMINMQVINLGLLANSDISNSMGRDERDYGQQGLAQCIYDALDLALVEPGVFGSHVS